MKNAIIYLMLVSLPHILIGFFSEISLPEIYQDILINGQVVETGIRNCKERYEAIKPLLNSLPEKSKVLDIGASQGYFSFKMAEDFCFRCCMVEGGYKISDYLWKTGELLNYLCKQNLNLQDVTLLQHQFSLNDLKKLQELEEFDLVIAFSVVHHMRETLSDPMEQFAEVIDTILKLGNVVLIENPINTGDHTLFIRDILRARGGNVIYQSFRGTLIYEIYLFDQRKSYLIKSKLSNIRKVTYEIFNGTYSSIKGG